MSKIFSPFRIIMCFLAVVTVALLVLPELKIDLLPETESSAFSITYSQPNTAPDIMEQQTTSIIEGACSQLGQLKKITSVSRYNSGYVQLKFDKSADIQMKYFEVAAIIRRIYPKLPLTTSYPSIEIADESNTEQHPLLIYSVNAPLQPYYIKHQAEDVFQKTFAGIIGLKEVKVSGTENQQLSICFNRDKCQAWNIRPALIISQLQSLFANAYPGIIHNASGENFFLELKAPVTSISAIESILIPVINARTVCLKDIANIYIEEQEPVSYFRINSKNSVSLSFYARSGENKILLGKLCRRLVQKVAKQLPAGYDVRLDYDDTEFLEKEISKNYQRMGLSAGILVLFIMAAYRNWRYLFNLFAGLLVTICLTIILAWLFNTGIHLYTIAGLAISFGIMIDNAIVILDYYHRFRSVKIFTALLAATLTTVSALLIVFFLPEEERNNLSDFSVIIILALIASLITALWFIPGLYQLTMPAFKYVSSNKLAVKNGSYIKRKVKIVKACYLIIGFIARYRKGFACLMVIGFGLPVFMLPASWEGKQWYNNWYNASLGNEYYQENIRPHVDAWLGGALRLFVNNVYEKSGYRNPEKTKLYINAELPYGNTPEQMNGILEDFENYLSGSKAIDKYTTNVYSGQNGTIEINFKEEFERSSLPYQLKSRLIARSLNWGGIEWNIYGVGQGFSNASGKDIPSYRVTMKGYNYDELQKQAAILKEKLLNDKRVKKVNTNERMDYSERQSQEYVLNFDKDKMAFRKASQVEILNALQDISKPVGAAVRITMDDKYFPVILKEKDADEFSIFDLLHHPVQLESNKTVSLNEIGKVDLVTTANSIYKEDRQYVRVVSFEYMGSLELGNKHLKSVLEEMKQQMPVGYTAERSKSEWNWANSTRNYLLISALILAIFFICSILFENLKEPFFIISMIPVSFIGLFLTFSIGDFYFDQGGYAAFVMLGGLVANAAIFIVNDFNNLRKKRSSALLYNKLLIKATVNRARTILLTTISTCCGLIPFLIEGQNEVFWFSLAVGTIGGLVFSLLANFIVLPVLLWKKTNKS